MMSKIYLLLVSILSSFLFLGLVHADSDLAEATITPVSCESLLSKLQSGIRNDVIGQNQMVEILLVALLNQGHVLFEGPPGVAKTTLIKSLVRQTGLTHGRISLGPDTLPADIKGKSVFNSETNRFELIKGPIFNNILLADELNRTPPKTQAALLEAMEEGRVTIGDKTYDLPEPFIVIATQNPRGQEGTYPLPEAQLDRFFLKSNVNFPSIEEEEEILNFTLNRQRKRHPPLSQNILFDWGSISDELDRVVLAGAAKRFLLKIIEVTRNPIVFDEDLSQWIEGGVGPRGSKALAQAAQVIALMDGRSEVRIEDIKSIAAAAIAHRLSLTISAKAEEQTPSTVVKKIIEKAELALSND